MSGGLELDGVSKVYGQGAAAVEALRQVGLTVEAGEFVTLLGPSGSGKTTFLNLVGGIEAPTHGRILSGDWELTGLDPEQRTAYRRERVGFVFQFFNLVPTLTASENVELVLELTGGDPRRAREALEAVGLGERMDRFPGQLSGGEQQRVAVARAIAKLPQLLLCDEPTGALDLDTGRGILGLIRGHNRQAGCTVVLVTHNTAISEMADRVIRLRSGEVVDDWRNGAPIEAGAVSW